MLKNLKITGSKQWFEESNTYVLNQAIVLSMPASGKTSLVKELNRSCYGTRDNSTHSFIASDYDFKMPNCDSCRKKSSELIDWMMTTSFEPIKVLCAFPHQVDPQYINRSIPIVFVLPDEKENLAIRSWVRFLMKKYGNAKSFPLSFTKLTVQLSDIIDEIAVSFSPFKDMTVLLRRYKNIVRNGLKMCSFNDIDEFNRKYLYYYYDWLQSWWRTALEWQSHYDSVIISELPRGKYLSELFTFSYCGGSVHE